ATKRPSRRDSPHLPERIHSLRRSRAQRGRAGRSVLERLRGLNDVLGVDTTLFHYFGAGRAQTEFMQADDFAVEANILIPNLRNSGFDRNPFTTRLRKNVIAIFFRLAINAHKDRRRNTAGALAAL